MSRYCGYIKKVCDKLVYSVAVTFTAPNLIINLPAGSYEDGRQFCIVITEAIPETTTINAPVFFTIGTGTVLYPFVDCTGNQLTARNISTRYRFSVCVGTTATGGSFRLMGRACVMAANNSLTAIDGTAPADDGAAAGGAAG